MTSTRNIVLQKLFRATYWLHSNYFWKEVRVKLMLPKSIECCKFPKNKNK